jgi:hypothetical protein
MLRWRLPLHHAPISIPGWPRRLGRPPQTSMPRSAFPLRESPRPCCARGRPGACEKHLSASTRAKPKLTSLFVVPKEVASIPSFRLPSHLPGKLSQLALTSHHRTSPIRRRPPPTVPQPRLTAMAAWCGMSDLRWSAACSCNNTVAAPAPRPPIGLQLHCRFAAHARQTRTLHPLHPAPRIYHRASIARRGHQ